MTYPTKTWLVLCAVILYSCGVWFAGYHSSDKAWQLRDTERNLSEAATANQAWAERFALQAQLATRDQQLAESQALAAQKRTVVVVQKEIIYRDKIKDVAVRDCVANSGLLDVYDATLGLSNSAE